MDFITLCRQFAGETGTISGVPNFTTVENATGRIAQAVAAVRNAWIDIQNERNDWLFLRAKITDADLVSGTAEYSGASFGITRFGQWMKETVSFRPMSIYDPAIGKSDEGELQFIPYYEWVRMYERGVHDQNRPCHWSSADNGNIVFGPTPDKAYKFCGRYIKSPQELSADGDEPDMPKQYHRVIIGEAIRLIARNDEAFASIQAAASYYDRLRGPLVSEQTPELDMWGYGPLA